MKTLFALITVFVLLTPASGLTAKDLGKMLTKISEGIKPEAYTNDFKAHQADWAKQASAMDADDLDASKEQVGSLINGLNSEALDTGAKESLLTKLANAGSLSDLGDVTGALVNHINPSFLTKELATNKETMLKGLAAL